jgi:outer membrane receptor protein involved in Fe transport
VGFVVAIFSSFASAEEGRRIEEIVVTAEKRESTVSDTSISITAFGEDMLEDMGIQGPNELVNFIPSTTRDAYDIRIRGVGRNFRALGGDPGVATYYNGVYSEDFGIAATENGLYDVQRVEVLRGPQGTLYGRNAIGGALNYINNAPTYEFEGELRAQVGSFNTREVYGVLSGPVIDDVLAVRLTGVKRDRDGSQDGIAGTEDLNTIHDQNFAIALKWNISDAWEANIRWNDRASDRIIGQSIIIDEGLYDRRGQTFRDDSLYVYGVRGTTGVPISYFGTDGGPNGGVPLTATDAGAIPFTDPLSGATVYGALNRAGVDPAHFPYTPTGAFGISGVPLNSPDDLDDVKNWGISDNTNDEVFDHNAVTFDLTWDINDTTSLKYIGGYSDFRYTFDLDIDRSQSDLGTYRATVIEDVYTYSHELQLLWQIGDKLQMTSGIYNFYSNRYQDYTLTDAAGQGRITDPTNYGNLALAFGAPFGTPMEFVLGNHSPLGTAPVGTSVSGVWGGDPLGHVYHHQNLVENTSYAVFTQGTYTFNDEFSVVVGVRWAEDEKEAFEDRGGYFEFASFLSPYLSDLFGIGPSFFPGMTPLAAANILMGNAAPSGNPDNPIIPLCSPTASSCPNPMRLVGVPVSYNSRVTDKQKWDDVTWRLNFDWTPTDDILVYLSATTGYRAGGFSLGVTDARDVARDPLTGMPLPGGDIKPLTYDEETVLAYEVGYKGTHFDGQLQLFASIYLYDYEGYQDRVNAFDAVRQQSVDVVQNAGDAKNSGFEVEFMWLASDNLTIGGNYSLTKTEYDSDYFVLDYEDPSVPIGVFGSIADGTNPLYYTSNVKGNELKRIPEHKATIWASYDWIFSSGILSTTIVHSYTGEYQTTPLDRRIDLTPDRNRTDISLIWRDNTDRWVVRAFVDNVFDDQNLRGVNAGGQGDNFRRTGDVLYPRYAGLDVTWRFGGI